jgi:hypothetical protein
LECRNCGDLVDPRRVELGYDYCLKKECQQRCMARVLLASVAVNKAADYYSRAEDVLAPPPHAVTLSIDADEGPPRRHGSRPAKGKDPHRKTTLQRLHELEAGLDQALDRAYERFRRGEITAKEMDRERDQLVESFDRRIMNENIRYRSMLRGRGHGPHSRR